MYVTKAVKDGRPSKQAKWFQPSFSIDCLAVSALAMLQIITSSHQVTHHVCGRGLGFIYRQGNRDEERGASTVHMHAAVLRLLLAWNSLTHLLYQSQWKTTLAIFP